MPEPGKEAAGEAAAALVEDGARLGLGSGSTVACFLHALAARGVDVAGVPTSEETAARCRELGIGVLQPGDVDSLELCVDGADELDPRLTLTKGGGGALLREKVVAAMSETMVVIATPDKQVERLADSFPLPVETVPFAAVPVSRRLEQLGFAVEARDGGSYRTDNGNLILDCRMPGGLPDPAGMAPTLSAIPGIAEHGLFVGLADRALLGREDRSVLEVTPAADGSPAAPG